MKAVVAAFNQEKALVGAFSVITNLRMELFEALACTENLYIPHSWCTLKCLKECLWLATRLWSALVKMSSLHLTPDTTPLHLQHTLAPV